MTLNESAQKYAQYGTGPMPDLNEELYNLQVNAYNKGGEYVIKEIRSILNKLEHPKTPYTIHEILHSLQEVLNKLKELEK